MATLFLMVGLPGTGKTTAAKRLEVERDALRLTKDADLGVAVELRYLELSPAEQRRRIDRRRHRWPPAVDRVPSGS